MAKKDSNFNPIGRTRRIGSRISGIADWKGADSSKLCDAICAAAIVGGAIRFGYSRDGGAYAIGIYGDGEPYTVFVKPNEDIDMYLDDIIDLFEGIKDDKHPTGTAP